MKLIANPEQLVDGTVYWFRNKQTMGIFSCVFNFGLDKSQHLQGYDIIECETPTSADFDRLIQESE